MNKPGTDSNEMEDKLTSEGISGGSDEYSGEMQDVPNSKSSDIYSLRFSCNSFSLYISVLSSIKCLYGSEICFYCRNYDSGSDQKEVAFLDGKTDSSRYYDEITEGNIAFFFYV